MKNKRFKQILAFLLAIVMVQQSWPMITQAGSFGIVDLEEALEEDQTDESETTEAVEGSETAGEIESTEAVDATEAVEATEEVEATEVIEATETVETTEEVEGTEAAEVIEETEEPEEGIALYSNENMTVVQAENEAYTFRQGYVETFERDYGTLVKSYDASQYKAPTYESLSQYFDKSNTAYFGWLVEAPKDGDYTVSFQGEYHGSGANFEDADNNPYVAVVVNGGENVYKSIFTGSDTWYSPTREVSIRLKKGINTIYAVPITQERYNGHESIQAHLDYISIDSKLALVEWNQQALKAADAPVIYNYNNVNAGDEFIGGANVDDASSQKLYIEGLNKDSVTKVPSYSYYINVPEDGYYDMTVPFSGDKWENAFGLLVDGEPQVKRYKYREGRNWDWRDHKVDVSSYLTEGLHTITVTMQLPVNADAAQNYEYKWTDLGPLTITGGLTSAIEMDTYKTEDYGYTHLYASNGGGCSIGPNYDPTKAVTEEQLTSGLDKSKAPYIEYTLVAEEDGECYVTIPYVKDNAVKDAFYMTLQVNGSTIYRANALEPVKISLKKGTNMLRCLPYTKESLEKLVAAGQNSGWVDLREIKVQKNCGVTVKNKSETVLTLYPGDSVYHENFGTVNPGGSVGGANTGNEVQAMTLEKLSPSTLPVVAYIARTITVPSDGYYDISMEFGIDWNYRSGYYFGYMIDGVKQPDIAFSAGGGYGSNENWGDIAIEFVRVADFSTWLTAGEHTLVFTQHLPKDNTVSYANWGSAWTDFNKITICGGATVSENQVDPAIHPAEMDSYTTGEYGITHLYNENGGGCSIDAGYEADKAVTEKALTAGIQKGKTPYVEYILKAENAGEYYIQPLYSAGNKVGSAYYMTVQVNGSQVKHADSTEPVKVSLKQGKNIVRLIPYTKESLEALQAAGQNAGWVDQNGIKVQKDSGVTVEKPEALTLNAGDAPYHENFNTVNEGGSVGGVVTSGVVQDMTLENLTAVSLPKVGYISYTLHVPEDGYYDISVDFGVDDKYRDGGYAFGYLIDGEKQNSAEITTNLCWTADFSARLTAGDHTLVFVQHLPKNGSTNYEDWGSAWTDFVKITAYGGITLSAEQQDPVQRVKLQELKPGTYGMTNGYASVTENEAGECFIDASAGADDRQSEASLKEFVDKSISPYVAYIVNAPADGDYWIQPEYVTGGELRNAYYMTVAVNGEAVYRIDSYSAQQVTLKEGRNVLYLIPYTKESQNALAAVNQNSGWVNQTGLKVDKALTAVKPETLTVTTKDVTYYGNFNKSAERFYDAATNGDVCGMTLDTLKPADLKKVSYFAYTVEVPEKGYYDISVGFNADWAYRTGYHFGFMVDGEVKAVPFTMLESNLDSDRMDNVGDFSVYLTKGVHELVFIQHLPKSKSVTYPNWGNAWVDFTSVKFNGGIKAAAEQINPVESSGLRRIEAEDDTYVIRNLFGAWDPYNMKQKMAESSGGYVVGDIDLNTKQTYSELREWLDKASTAYLAYSVDAPSDGTYRVSIGYMMHQANMSDYRAVNGNPYMTVLVNGEDTYKASYGAPDGKIADSEVEVRLKRGRNVIYFIPITYDQKSKMNGDFWCNVDYIEFSRSLTLIEPSKVAAEAENAVYTRNFYSVGENDSASGKKFIGGASMDGIRKAQVTTKTLSQDNLRKTPHFAYTINVPADGYYDLTLGYSSEGKSEYFGILLDGKPYGARFSTTNGIGQFNRLHADVSTYLTAGTHIIAAVSEMPRENVSADAYGWTDFDALYLTGGITIASEQLNPYDKVKMTYLEAEDWAYQNNYTSIEEALKYSGGKCVGGANAAKQYTDNAMKMLDRHEQDFIEYILDAPADGEYRIQVGIEFGSGEGLPADVERYVLLYVNGEAVKLPVDSANGEVADVPAMVNLVQGRNVIRVTGIMKDLNEAMDNKVWVNHDYLAVQEGITPIENNGGNKVEAEDVPYMNNFLINDQEGASGDKILGGSSPSAVIAGVTPSTLSRENFDAASYVSFTVHAPENGYYTLYGCMGLPAGDKYGEVGLIVDNTSYPLPLFENPWAGKNPAETTVYMTEGDHLVIVTGLLKNSLASNEDATWLDYDFFLLGGGLILAEKQQKPTTLTKYTRYELEDYAMGNRFYMGENNDMSGKAGAICNDAAGVQTYSQLKEDGLDGVKTPYIQLSVEAPSDGTYKTRLGKTFQYSGEQIKDETDFAVLVNGELQKFSLQAYNNEYSKPFPMTLELKLKKGMNNVLITYALADPDTEMNLASTGYDYLEVTGGLKLVESGGRIEAEDSEYYGYSITAQEGCSAGMALMNEDWETVFSNDMTFANLNNDNYKSVPFVKYTVVAEEAGTYYFGAGINSGGSCPEDEVFLGMSINDGEFQKLNFRKAWGTTVLFSADLKEGENTILLTGALKDFLNYPKFPASDGCTNLWIDQDYLDLPAGVSAVKAEAVDLFKGDDGADYHDSLTSVWGDFTGNGSSRDADELKKSSTAGAVAMAVAGAAAVTAAIIPAGYAIAKKKKKKQDEESDTKQD